jgi:hypothetical protein
MFYLSSSVLCASCALSGSAYDMPIPKAVEMNFHFYQQQKGEIVLPR